MRFSVFAIFNLVTRFVICSVDPVDSERFVRERKSYQKACRNGQNYVDPSIDLEEQEKRSKLNKCLDRVGCIWILGLRQIPLKVQLIAFTHYLVALYITLKSLIFSTISLEDANKNEKLIFLDAIYVLNLFRKFKLSQTMNQALLLLFLPILLVRSRILYLKLRNAHLNRHRYHKINVLQLNMAYGNNLTTNFFGWINFLRLAQKHKCLAGQELTNERGKIMKRFSAKLSNLSKIDRIYFYNQIEFGHCYKDMQMFDQDLGKLHEKHEENVEKNAVWSRMKHLLRSQFHTYAQIPPHRFCASYMAAGVVFFIGVQVFYSFSIVVLFFAFGLGELESVGFQLDDIYGSSIPTLLLVYQDSRIVLILFEIFLIEIILVMNLFDNGLLINMTVGIHSRGVKLVEMLQRELSQIKLTGFDKQFPGVESTKEELKPTIIKRHMSSIDATIRQLELDEKSYKLSRGSIRWMLDKRCEVNENISYILDLVGILQDELDDGKRIFATYLNANIIFGTIGSAYSAQFFIDSERVHEKLLGVYAGFISVLPVLFALFMSASCERVVSSQQTSKRPQQVQ